MDKISKALKKLSPKEKRQVKKLLLLIQDTSFESLNLKKLKGHKDIFRVRKGDIRIIFRLKKEGVFILALEHRSEKTYKGF